jgi:hypothetical protein
MVDESRVGANPRGGRRREQATRDSEQGRERPGASAWALHLLVLARMRYAVSAIRCQA